MPSEEPGAQRHVRPGLADQRVADAADGVDQAGLDVVELAAQVADVGLDDAAVAAEVVLPHVVEDLRLRQHPALVDQQVAQQVVLGGRERHLGRRAGHPVGVVVELEVGAASARLPLRAAPVRRRTASMRATSSSRLNGFTR